METGAHLQQRPHAAVDFHPTGCGIGYARQYFQDSAFSRTVSSDEADHLAALDLKGDIL